MTLIRPFRGLRPKSEFAKEVVAPPYDVLNSAEAREQVKGRPWSFLHISKPEIDLPEGVDPFDETVYSKGADNLARMIKEEILVRDSEPCYYVYRLIMGDHEQTGLVAVASVQDYDTNRIRKHEFTRPVKENDRVRQIDALNTQTGPVFLTYRNDIRVDTIIRRVVTETPDVDLTAGGGVQHALWKISDHNINQKLTELFDAMECLYIADGHHRSAAASRVADMRRKENMNHDGNEDYNYFLSVIFPDNQMHILDYNRVVRDLNGLEKNEFLDQVGERFQLEESDQAVRPSDSGEFGMYLDGQWYYLRILSRLVPDNNPVARLDVSLLADHLIEPVLGISDPRTDSRIDFVGGIRGLKELEKRVDSGEMAVAFSMFPTSMADLMSVADANGVMPPKSTWFEPKLADGLVSHVLG